MANAARVHQIDALRQFKADLLKFAQDAQAALDDANGEIQRTVQWLERDQRAHWLGQRRIRHDRVEQCKEALRLKKLYKDSSGRFPNPVDEERALARAKAELEEAQRKILAVERWTTQLHKEILLYKGSIQGIATTLSSDVPVAAAQLEQWWQVLQSYVAAAPPQEQRSEAPPASATPINQPPTTSMARPAPDEPTRPPAPPKPE
jgi:hypothetical protein